MKVKLILLFVLVAFLMGGRWSSIVIGTRLGDELTGTVGDDLIIAQAGDDIIRPGPGSDRVICGPGYDVIEYNEDSDIDSDKFTQCEEFKQIGTIIFP